MPVEIRELVIKAVTTLPPETSATAAQNQPLPAGQAAAVSPAAEDDREAIIQECVRQVLRILQKQKER